MILSAASAAFLGGIGLAPAASASVDRISGAGATFPYPLYAKWADTYSREHGVKLNYQSIGSGGGINQISRGTVDFGASDAPLTAEELEKQGLVQFPTVLGGVVPVVNVPGAQSGQLKLTGELLADIYLGKVQRWNDPRIQALNPELELPDTRITVVHRSDGSGTTWIFTKYLSKVSPAWKDQVGTEKAVSWPVGVGGKGNEGVASYVKRIPGAIGYVEYAYAVQNKIPHAQLKNKDGQFVNPDARSFREAAASANWKQAKGFYVVLTDQPGAGSWPITGATFVLMKKQQRNPEVGREVLRFFDWAYRKGDEAALQLHYVPLPDDVVSVVQDVWSTALIGPGGEPIWKQGNTEPTRQGQRGGRPGR